MPLPYFDVSDTPDTVSSLYKQKIHWFFGPFQAFKYFLYLNKKYGEHSFKEKLVLFSLSCKLFLHAIYWIFGPIFIFFIILYPIFVESMSLFLFAYLIFLFYFTLPNSLALRSSDPRGDRAKLSSMSYSIIGGGIICYFLHGLSAISAVILAVKNLFLGKVIFKGKTVMRVGGDL
jgi:cellulose synthase/poly-beta-1,6-N-acetylglucosamine synthase-like glycosyltransferase